MSEKLGAERLMPEEWKDDLEALDLEIVRLAVICQVKLLEPGVIQHVLDNDARDCLNDHKTAFASLRGLLFLHFQMQKDLAEAYGPSNAMEIVRRVWSHLQPRIGDQLGSLPNPGPLPSA
ncbi:MULTISPECIES: hypothetical protein [Ralstonia solanacearum species complex]|uniref:Uncharacterized protein n=1 Tax=Ralstonia solanacearum IPO1609 TaxID=564066 RepID=A0A7U7JEJ0_RALSL|nr:hypothetical protein [Ralstonia solanacearum]ALF90424.1 hypothetical protein RSUY_41200 [Ralstonia solanacearum]ATI29885.1 hypothetical protein CCY86_20650 [Ralstonia solanacearum]KEI30889.1 hypothetical protein CQ06_02485 [Ralstonia solanacearum]KFX77087.1 hypothetical protein KR98_21130 [Ralstonia solanacearum]KFX82117.1 hypothetical protein KR99_19185 [Ralstonia solanacearum]